MKKIILSTTLLSAVLSAATFNAPMQAYINDLKVQAKAQESHFVDFDAKRGAEIFTSTHIGKRGTKMSCTSCHTIDLRQEGKNERTNKILKPLAPSANPERLTQVRDVKKWLRRNFNDVYNRVGTAKEKGDVLYYINSK
ncbi:DUF1924 domain-containing protein [Sulfurospirillum sp. 1612]|uniref:DUF1924 domain-containing protein n=1 Tax=Sulfurospirillum sp. 1612 TaxID=3094835 RepID=UPI002F945582